MKRACVGAVLLSFGLAVATPASAQSAGSERASSSPAGAESNLDVDPEVQAAPEPTWDAVALRADIGAGVFDCPPPAQVGAWANELVGRAFVIDSAPVELRIAVDKTPNQELRLELTAKEFGSPKETAEPRLLRRFQNALPCSELLRAAALTISLFAINPRAPRETESGVAGPKPRATPADDAPALFTTGGEPQARPPQPKQQAKPATSSSPAAENRAEASPDRVNDLTPILALDGYGALGVNPGGGLGGGAQVGLHSTLWEVRLRAGAMASAPYRLTPAPRGQVRAPTSEVALALCRLLRGRVTWSLCGFGGQLWLYAHGEQFENNHELLKRSPFVGASGELLWMLGPQLGVGPRLELLVPLVPWTYQVTDEPDAAWKMWSLAPRMGISVEWRNE
ncbi:MAG TPA: hypothetical protein VHM70_09515 [Polyangiaceae bacterium]|nr:hypothetical protein [Polyangiaceae bacterium]